MSVDVMCLGETMALVAPDPPRPLALADRLVLSSAGAESNVAAGLARLGTSAHWCSRVGDDPLGHRIVADLEAVGVGTDCVRFSTSARTGLMLKDPAADRTRVLYYRDRSAASEMDESDADRALSRRPAVLHLSGITSALSESCARAVARALDQAAGAGTRLSFDVNLRPALWADHDRAAAELHRLAQRCDMVFVGLDEAAALWSTATAEEVRELIDAPDVLVVKDSARCATSFDADGHVAVDALPITVVEPVGAGDAFAAGWLHAHLRGLSAEQKLRLGHLVAAHSLMSATDSPADWIPAEQLRAMAGNPAAWPPREWPPREWPPPGWSASHSPADDQGAHG
jgi:2-dehydro-3-deoxygluconokinase